MTVCSLLEREAELKPIGLLFKAPLMRANLAGRKTVTRRNVSRTNSLVSFRGETPHQVSAEDWDDLDWSQAVHDGESWQVCQKHQDMGRVMVPVYVYPRWQPGQVMWAKETWKSVAFTEYGTQVPYQINPRSIAEQEFPEETAIYRADWPSRLEEPKWQSAMLMKRWASRFSRPLVSVKPTRLQEIADADALLEGILTFLPRPDGPRRADGKLAPLYHWNSRDEAQDHTPREAFQRLFESILGPEVWEQNIPLWRVEYANESANQW